MKNRLIIFVLLSVVAVVLAAAPVEKAEPVGTHRAVLHSLQILLPKPTADQEEAQAYAKDLFGKLEKHFEKVEGVSPTQFNTGMMLHSLRWRDVIIHFAVDKKLDDSAVITKLKSFPFKTTVLLNKTSTTTETFEIKTP
jgi:hypothetical protein